MHTTEEKTSIIFANYLNTGPPQTEEKVEFGDELGIEDGAVKRASRGLEGYVGDDSGHERRWEWWGKFLMNLRTGLKMGTTTLKPETKDKKKLRFELGSRHSGHGGDSQIDHVEVENQMQKEQDINLRWIC
ncbi:hypothetical protein B0H19DRAFT_1074316 [Mycena capillaripes]|nr:hypothetical protein B0H19DRAFT_1074316 [Mycena capillaripes]